jgi:hypothetical protein
VLATRLANPEVEKSVESGCHAHQVHRLELITYMTITYNCITYIQSDCTYKLLIILYFMHE